MSQQPVKRPRGRPRKNPIPHVEPQEVSDIDKFAPSVAGKVEPSQPMPLAPTLNLWGDARRLKVHIYPSFGESDDGDGGIRRVVEAQLQYLPKHGVDIVKTAAEADIIACHAIIPSTYPTLYSDKVFVSMIHGLYWSEYNDWQNWAIKANVDVMESIRIADEIIVPSEWVANAVRRNTCRPVTVISHGINAENWKQEPSLGYVLWNKTRPDPVCDPAPMNSVAELLSDVQFLSTFGKETENVKLIGRHSFEEAKTVIQKAGVYLATTRETFGIGTLEAMVCGVPVVGFRWGGQAEFITHKVDGWLANPNDIEDLAKGIKWALENREKIGNAAREKAVSFNWDKIAERYVAVFQKAYQKKTRFGPRTSIVVTNYNLHNYLEACIDSVIAQTDKDWECIIVDDASPDPESWPAVERMVVKDNRIRAIGNTKNVYLSEARNIGIRSAKGKYILPLDADDMLAPEAVELLANELDKDKSIHIAYGGVLFVDEDGITPTDYKNPRVTVGHSGWPMPFAFEQQIIQRNLLPYCSMYRKEAWEYVGGYRRRQRTAEDAEMWVRLSSYGFRPKMVTKEDTLIYRNREGSMSRTQGGDGWLKWYSWAKDKELVPAGAVTQTQLPVYSYDPVVVSVIIPVGPGHEQYIQDAVDSVEAQTFRNWECIVINDTGKDLPELPSWVKVLNTEGLMGPARARNIGIKASKGKLFLPLDADDYLEPDALKIMFEAYSISKDIIYTDFWQTDMEGKNITVHECDDYDPQLITGKTRTVNGIKRQGMVHTVTALTPKEAWEAVNGYDEKLPAWEDWDFAMSVADKGYCSRRVAMPLFTYRKHTGMRRQENYEFFERSKESFMEKWSKIWNGGYQLAACSSCSGKRTSYTYAPASQTKLERPLTQTAKEATLVEYVGPKLGSTPYKGTSGTVYWFGASDAKKWVLNSDLEVFARFSDFRILNQQESPSPVISEYNAPVLVAEGPP